MKPEHGTMNERQAAFHSSFRVPTLSFVTLLLLLLPVALQAQTSQRIEPQGKACPQAFALAEAEREFATAAGEYQRKSRQLVESRVGSFRGSVAESESENPFLRELTASLSAGFESGTAILFYAADENFLRIWLINHDGIQAFHRAPLSLGQIQSAIASVRESLDVEDLVARRLPPRLRPNKRAAPSAPNPKTLLSSRLATLTSFLLPNELACALRSVSHLIIVPILDLGTVPFAALRPFGPSEHLIDKMSVMIAPSLSDIVTENLLYKVSEKNPWSARFRNPLLVGNPYLAPSAGWEPLDNARKEAEFVGQLFKAKPLVGRQATKAEIIKRAQGADFLYFATHGAADTANPLEGGFLVFSGPNGKEGLWTAREIQQTSLPARLAVLSACQTGLGKTHDAGIIGLARAFQLAGVRRVVMSLWSVYDDATAELMRAFALNLEAHAPAEALRRAMLQVRRRRPDPAEWASFVIFGATP